MRKPKYTNKIKPTTNGERFSMKKLPTITPRKPVLQKAAEGGRFIPAAEAVSLISDRNCYLLNAGHMLTVRPGVTLRKVKSGAATRYQLNP